MAGLGVVAVLFGACSTLMIVTDYRATIVFNDSADLRAECQMANSFKPERDWIGPGEMMLAHSGTPCGVHNPDGTYYGCLPEGLIADAGGRTIHVTEANGVIPASDCSGFLITGSFNVASFRPDLRIPSEAEQQGIFWRNAGFVLCGGLLVLALGVALRGRLKFGRSR